MEQQEHNDSFQVLKGIYVEGDETQRDLCYRPRINDGNEEVIEGVRLSHKNNILLMSRVQMWL